jgi:hypothetical protein
MLISSGEKRLRSAIAGTLGCSQSEIRWQAVFLRRLKAIYVCNPKVAGSTIIATMIRADAGSLAHLMPRDHNTPDARDMIGPMADLMGFHRALNSAEYFQFAFVRNPYSRIVSSFLEKMHRNPTKAKWRRKVGVAEDHAPTLLEFLSLVEGQDPAQMDRHWRTQHRLIPETVRLDFIGRFEAFDTDLASVMKRLGVAGSAIHSRIGHSVTADAHVGNLVGPLEKELIDHIYEGDFERFGYPRVVAG